MRLVLPGFIVPLALPYVRWTQIRRAARVTMADPEAGYAASVALIEAVSARLEDGLFMCGDRPSTVDCCIWPVLLHVATTPNSSPPREAVRADTRLVRWIERVGSTAGYELGSAWRGGG